MSTESPVALRVDACPEPGLLAAYVDGTVASEERTRVERHLVACPDCREIVAGAVSAQAEIGRIAAPRRPSRTWIAIAGSAAAAAAAVTVFVLLRTVGDRLYVRELKVLVELDTQSRPIEPRLTGGFRYAPPPAVLRGAARASNLELSATAQKVRSEIGDRAGAPADAARGVTFLLSGDADRAVEALERAAASASPSANMFNDLAAAYLQR